MPQQAGSVDPVFEEMSHKLRLLRDRWAIKNGRVIVAEPVRAIRWLDREIAEMEAGQ
ncbi:hypothetical protein D3C71_1341510 [compost metagenome]